MPHAYFAAVLMPALAPSPTTVMRPLPDNRLRSMHPRPYDTDTDTHTAGRSDLTHIHIQLILIPHPVHKRSRPRYDMFSPTIHLHPSISNTRLAYPFLAITRFPDTTCSADYELQYLRLLREPHIVHIDAYYARAYDTMFPS
ncbi:hypothetical protein B0H13DRAFT_2348401 [Mycena leptocephala]|nr:hypothetical protein B0H13DRAFT_2348401 [Mycena leptocephala]